jgi:Lipid A 3-O-deacylase (PagL)
MTCNTLTTYVRGGICAALLILFVTALPLDANAGFCNATSTEKHDFGFFAGYSPASTTWIGTTTDRRLLLTGFQYSYTCWTAGFADISYTAGVLPLTFLLQPAQGNYRTSSPPVIPAHSVYGAGVLPIGLTAHFGRHVVRPFFAAHGGIYASTEPIPINAPDATGLNFLFDFGPGLSIQTGQHGAINVGYKFLHISNAYTTAFNPGVDNNVVFVGFSLRL